MKILNFKKFLTERRYWGKEAAGVLPFCTTTKRFLLGLRSNSTMDGDTYGTFGGKFDNDDDEPEDVALRELEEETGYDDEIKLIPLYTFKDDNFIYHNFLGLVSYEFEADLNWENDDAFWVDFDELIEIEPKHHGLKTLLEDSDALEKLMRYSK
jgi:8-oxo-dGTP pyrophosphatase MutT (NUDIX family)